eukprot:scaffold633_cov321-Pavlova_lutheri.AAC.44
MTSPPSFPPNPPGRVPGGTPRRGPIHRDHKKGGGERTSSGSLETWFHREAPWTVRRGGDGEERQPPWLENGAGGGDHREPGQVDERQLHRHGGEWTLQEAEDGEKSAAAERVWRSQSVRSAGHHGTFWRREIHAPGRHIGTH